MHDLEDAPGWDSAALLPLDLDDDVAAIARWAAAHDVPLATTDAAAAALVEEDEADDDGVRSGRTDSASDSSAPTERKRLRTDAAPRARRVRKPRKSTYTAQKELKSVLADEIRVLEARLELLQMRAGVPTSEDKRSVASVQAANFEIEEAIHANLLSVACFHSMISKHMHTISVGPMSTLIRLPKDMAERHATLRAMRDMKVRRARELLENRMQHVDNYKPFETEERYFSDDGTFHCKRFEVWPFEGAHDVRQVFDALLRFYENMAPMLKKKARGRVAVVREDLDFVEPTIWLRRIVAEFGVATDPVQSYEQEVHSVGFARLFQPEKNQTQPFGVVAIDSIDEDELYPYKPLERVRKDITAAISVREEPATSGPPRRVVVVRKSTFLTLHKPPFSLTPAARDDMRVHMSDWCGAWIAALREALPSTSSYE